MKKEFEFQYYYRSWLGYFPIFILIILLNFILGGIDAINNNSNVYFLINIIVMIITLVAYYKFTKNISIFIGKGYYWVKDGIVFIKLNKREYRLDNVQELLGDVKDIYSNKYATLFVQTDKDKIKIFPNS
jgi:hypothetical protein